MPPRILYWSITSALAGFLFGFDTVVISGAEQTIQKLWGLSDTMHGYALGSALYGMVIGSLLGGWPTDHFGRRKTLLWVGLLFLLSAVGCGFANGFTTFFVARFLGGLGIGVSTVAAPLYISEISPPAYRGRLAGVFQFNIVFGILVAFVSNYYLKDVGANAWRWMLGVAAVPSLIYTVMSLGLPESPRWLISHQSDRAAGIAVLRLMEPGAAPERLEELADEITAGSPVTTARRGFFTWRLRLPIMLAFLVAFFNQLSGINAVLYFAPRIFEMTGLGAKAALLQSAGIGVTNLLFTFVGLWLIDRAGRRTLLYLGSVGYIASLGLTSWAFFTHHYTIVPVCIFAFIASHAVGQGAVIWVFISEIFPNRYRASGTALGCGTHWVFAAVITTVFPRAVNAFPPGYIFAFFAFMMVLQLVWVKTMVVETKGVALEQIQRDLGIEAEA